MENSRSPQCISETTPCGLDCYGGSVGDGAWIGIARALLSSCEVAKGLYYLLSLLEHIKLFPRMLARNLIGRGDRNVRDLTAHTEFVRNSFAKTVAELTYDDISVIESVTAMNAPQLSRSDFVPKDSPRRLRLLPPFRFQ